MIVCYAGSCSTCCLGDENDQDEQEESDVLSSVGILRSMRVSMRLLGGISGFILTRFLGRFASLQLDISMIRMFTIVPSNNTIFHQHNTFKSNEFHRGALKTQKRSQS